MVFAGVELLVTTGVVVFTVWLRELLSVGVPQRGFTLFPVETGVDRRTLFSAERVTVPVGRVPV